MHYFNYSNYIWLPLNWKSLGFLCTYWQKERRGLLTCTESNRDLHSSSLWGTNKVCSPRVSTQVFTCIFKKRIGKAHNWNGNLMLCQNSIRSSNTLASKPIFLLTFNNSNSTHPATLLWSEWKFWWSDLVYPSPLTCNWPLDFGSWMFPHGPFLNSLGH